MPSTTIVRSDSRAIAGQALPICTCSAVIYNSLCGITIFTAGVGEAHATHAVRCIKEARRRRMTRVEIGQGPHERYFRDVQRRQQNTVFVNHSCASSNSYYFDKHGDAPMLRPSTTMEMLWRAQHFPMEHYRFSRTKAAPMAELQNSAAVAAA